MLSLKLVNTVVIISLLLRPLYWFSVTERIKHKLLLLIYKVLTTICIA